MLREEIGELADLAGFALQYFDEFGVPQNDCKRRLAYLAYKAARELRRPEGIANAEPAT